MDLCIIEGIGITAFSSMDEAVNYLLPPEGPRHEKLVAMNAEKFLRVRKDAALREILCKDACVYPDGAAIVWSLRKRSIEAVKIAGCELWEALMERAATLDLSVLLLGASEDVSKATAAKLARDCDLQRVARLNGFDHTDDEIVNLLKHLKPDVVTVALGSPRQEILIEKLRSRHKKALYMGVGGTYDVYTGRLKRAPTWMLRANLEFLYRLLQQPSRIRRQLKLLKYYWLGLTGRL